MRWQGLPLRRAGKDLQEWLAYSPDRFLEWQTRQRADIVAYHLQHNPFYRGLGIGPGTPWEELPILTKGQYQGALPSLLSGEYDSLRKVYVGNTSGSSGHPFHYGKDKYCHALTWAHVAWLYGHYGLNPESRQARFYGIPLDTRGYWTERLKDRIARRTRFTVFDLSAPVLARWLQIFARERFDYLYGYTSSMVRFARYVHDQGAVLKDICPAIKVCMVTSEVCTPEDRTVLERGFGVPVVNEYGASELGIIAFELPERGWVLSDPLIHVEVVDEAGKVLPDGVEGRLLCTSLFNRAMPFIRYEIGDIGAVTTRNGVRVLEKLSGRTNDMLHLPDGRVSPGLTFYYISRSILERGGFIREFIIRQTALDRVVFQIDARRPLTAAEKQMIRDSAKKYLNADLHIDIEEVDAIDRPGSGKIKHFYSELTGA